MTFFQSNCWIKHFTLSHKWNITKTYGTPVVPKILSSKSKTSNLSNAVSIILIAFLDQNVQNLKDSWFYSISKHIPKCEFFLEKSAKNFKLHNIVKTHSGIQKMCPTRRWESLDIILFSRIIFGYHNDTHGTQKYRYVKHKKWNRLERGHFELFGIRQQVLTKNIIMKISDFQSSFRKYLTSEQYMSFLTIFWQKSHY